MANYDDQTDTRSKADCGAYELDMRANTILKQNQNGGYDNATKPVGAPATPKYVTGNRGAQDGVAAKNLGAQGKQ